MIQDGATPHSAEPTDDGAGNGGSLPVHVAAGALPSVWAALERMATDPRADVEKLERMMALYERLEANRARQAYNEAMNLAQAEIEPVARTTENTVTRSFYAKLEAVDAAIRPIYTKHGFSLSDDAVAPLTPGNIRIQCRCAHIAGHTEIFHREAATDTTGPKGSPTKTPLHGGGSTETFLRRYLRVGIFNVVFKNLDDDGNGGPMGEAQIAELVELMIRVNIGPKFQRYMKWPVFDKDEHSARLANAGSPEAMWTEYLQPVPGADYGKAKSALKELEQIARKET